MDKSIFEAFPKKMDLEKTGLSSRAMLDMFKTIIQEELQLNSLLILKDGRLAFELHVYPYRPDTPRLSFSVVEGFITTAVGLVVDQGLLDIDERLIDIYPEYRQTDTDAYLKEMSVRHLLISSTGHDPISISTNPMWLNKASDNIVHHFMLQEVPFKPGERLRYEPTHLMLAHIIKTRSGFTAQQLLKKHIFQPVGMKSISWYEVGPEYLPMLLRATPLDYARFGLLMQNHGRWGDQQLISEEWVRSAATKQIDYPEGTRWPGCGYFFWSNNIGGFSLRGDHGQYICVIPERNLILVMTGTEPRSGRLYDVVVGILQAIDNESHPVDTKTLKELLTEMNQPLKVKPYLPPCAREISGIDYRFSPGQYFSPTCLTLRFENDDSFTVDFTNIRSVSSVLTGSLNGHFRIDRLPSNNALASSWRNEGTEVAVRGKWISDQIFEFEVRPLSYGTCMRCKLTFMNDHVQLYCKHNRREETLVAN